MKVGALIEALKWVNPELDVVIYADHGQMPFPLRFVGAKHYVVAGELIHDHDLVDHPDAKEVLLLGD